MLLAIVKVELSFIPSSDDLSVDDLQQVQETTWDARAKWYNCGLALGLPAGTLNAFKETHRGDCDNCYRETLIEWLKGANPQPSWSALCKALKSPTVGHEELAESMRYW